MGETRYQSRRLEAGRLLSFSAELANHQRQHDRHFILEHPDGASSWKKIVWLHLAPSQEFSFPVSISADLGCVARTPKNLSGKGHDWSTTSLKSMLSSTTSSVFVKSPTDRSRVLREASRFHRSVKRILPKWLTPCFLASRPQLVYRLWTEGFIAPGPKEK